MYSANLSGGLGIQSVAERDLRVAPTPSTTSFWTSDNFFSKSITFLCSLMTEIHFFSKAKSLSAPACLFREKGEGVREKEREEGWGWGESERGRKEGRERGAGERETYKLSGQNSNKGQHLINLQHLLLSQSILKCQRIPVT